MCAFLKYLFFQHVFNLSKQTKGPCLEMVVFFLGMIYIVSTLYELTKPVCTGDVFTLWRTFRAWSVGSQLCCPFSVATGQVNSPLSMVVRFLVCLGSGPACGLPFCDGLA